MHLPTFTTGFVYTIELKELLRNSLNSMISLSKLTELFQKSKELRTEKPTFVVADGTAPFMKAQNLEVLEGEVSPALHSVLVKDRILLTENGQEILDNLDIKPREVISQLHISGSKFIIGLNDFN